VDAELLEHARAVLQAAQAGDLSPLKELLDPEVDLIWSEASWWDCHNRDDVMRLLERLQRTGFGATEIELIDAGDDMLVTIPQPRAPRGEGGPDETATVITFRDGKAVHLWQFKTSAEALAAAQKRGSAHAERASEALRTHAPGVGEPAECAVPILPSRDLDETLAFYERLGFRSRQAHGETRRELSVVRGGIELRFYHAPELNPFAATATCYLRVARVDQLHQEWEQIGVPLDRGTGSRLVAPADAPDGSREFTLIDRNGNVLRVGSSPA
jgi:catechol 2,3-dioxygenase-like lactoylglutathione lyase family enzyme/ketosteroid isomerase-like protein